MLLKFAIRRAMFTVTASAAVAASVAYSGAARAAEGKSVVLLSPTEECTYCADYVRFFRTAAAKKA